MSAKFPSRAPMLAAILAAATAPPLSAQLPPSHQFQRVQDRFDDLGPLGSSLRVFPHDLRRPFDFDQVYRVPRLQGQPDQFARVSGAITAVYPRGEYLRTKKGVRVQVPAGTIFYIGRLPEPSRYGYRPGAQSETVPDPRAPERVGAVSTRDHAASSPVHSMANMNAHLGADDPVDEPALDAPVPLPAESIFTSEHYRIARLSALIDEARRAAP